MQIASAEQRPARIRHPITATDAGGQRSVTAKLGPREAAKASGALDIQVIHDESHNRDRRVSQHPQNTL
jgi:hypothetical protein